MKFMLAGRIPFLAAVLLTGCQGPSAAPGALSSFQLGMFQAAPSPQPVAVAAQPAAPVVPAAPAAAPTAAPTVAPTEPPRFGGGGYSAPAAPAPKPVGRLTVDLSAVVQTMFPPAAQRHILATVADVDHLVITIKMAGQPDLIQTVTAAEMQAGKTSAAFANLPTGSCDVVIQAFDATNTAIGTSSRVAPIAEDKDTAVQVRVFIVPNDGTYYTYANSLVFGVDLAAAPAAQAADGSGPVSGTVVSTFPTGFNDLYADGVGHYYVMTGGMSVVSGTAFILNRVSTADGSRLNTYMTSWAPPGNIRAWPASVIYDPIHQVIMATGTLSTDMAVPPGDTSLQMLRTPGRVMLHVDAAGDTYFPGSGFLQKVTATGNVATTIPAHSAFDIDTAGNFWVNGADVTPTSTTLHNEVRKYAPDGTLIGTYALPFPAVRIISDGEGGVWVGDRWGGQVVRVAADGTVGMPLGVTAAGFCIDGQHNLWVAGGPTLLKLAPDGTQLGNFPIAGKAIAYGDGYIFVGVGQTDVLKVVP